MSEPTTLIENSSRKWPPAEVNQKGLRGAVEAGRTWGRAQAEHSSDPSDVVELTLQDIRPSGPSSKIATPPVQAEVKARARAHSNVLNGKEGGSLRFQSIRPSDPSPSKAPSEATTLEVAFREQFKTLQLVFAADQALVRTQTSPTWSPSAMNCVATPRERWTQGSRIFALYSFGLLTGAVALLGAFLTGHGIVTAASLFAGLALPAARSFSGQNRSIFFDRAPESKDSVRNDLASLINRWVSRSKDV